MAKEILNGFSQNAGQAKDRLFSWWRFLRVGLDRAQDRSAIAPRRPVRPGNKMPLVSLAPKYQTEHHGVYLDLLERALRDPDTRSVALTGSYGSGKSSVLGALPSLAWGRRVIVKLSLSTLDPELAPAVQTENPSEREMSNRIQKELVKQLLYQLPPSRTRQSRFPRASKPTGRTGAIVAMGAALGVGLAWVLATLAGWQPAITDRLGEVGWSVQGFWSAVTIGFALLALAAWTSLAGRYALHAGLRAGAVTVRLEPTSSSYFDQYLDEIMYFFQVSKTNVVLIEDVDRFGDAVVFDTLRALNTLVNSSGQVGRRVVFVYAIRDSVLGQIGANEKNGNHQIDHFGKTPLLKPAPHGMERANRAKYFDVIIPIVPFVTSDNARDLMMQVMRPHVAETVEREGISPALIRLAARHVADMRTLWSIRNEFEVHLDRLVTSAGKAMPGITHDIVLSLVLLRTTSPGAYENIRLATSPLDTLIQRWLDLVDANLECQTVKLTDLRTQLESGESRAGRAEQAGQRLDSLRHELLPLAVAFAAGRVEYAGPVTDANLANLDGWRRIANGEPLTVSLRPAVSSRSQSWAQVRLSSQALARLIGMPVDTQAWQDADLKDLKDKIEATEEEISFLRHHTWKQLFARTDLTVAPEPGELAAEAGDVPSKVNQISFEGLVLAHGPTPLTRDLIAHGYLPRHFARYASMFYGEVVSLNAAEYISRAIEPGVPIPEYELDNQAIEQILSEQTAANDDDDFFDDLSVYNLDIVAHLIKHRAGAAQRVAAHMAERWGDLEKDFVGRFLQREDGVMAAALAAMMTPDWRRALRYTAVDAPVTPETRLRLVNAVLAAIRPDERVDLDTDVGRYLSEHYAELPALTDPPDEARAVVVMATVAAAGGTIRDLTVLQPSAFAAVLQVSIYPVTTTNLGALGGADHVALDVQRLQATTRPIYGHLLANLADYLDALAHLAPPGPAVLDPAEFASILNDIAGTPQSDLLDRLVGATLASCRVADLKTTAPETWPALVAHRRTDPEFGNVQLYIREHGLDETLGRFLSEHAMITTPETIPQSERLAMAAELLAAQEIIRELGRRVALTASIAPGIIPIGQIAPEEPNLVGPLLASKLLADAPETFDPQLLKNWDPFEAAVAASDQFGDFADTVIMPAHHLARTLKSDAVTGRTKAALIKRLDVLLPGVNTADANAIADVLASRHELLDRPRIEALKLAGASDSSLVRLIVDQGDTLPLEDLMAILKTMEGDYAKVSEGGRGTVRFTLNGDHKILLDRLEGVTHTGAKQGQTMTHGITLVANLRHPRS